MLETKVIALPNQKGGTGKTTTTVNLGAALALMRKKVLLVDTDPQGNLTTSLGWHRHDRLDVTLTTHLRKLVEDDPFPPTEGILRHSEGFDLMPANIELSSMELGLVNAMSREHIMKLWLESVKGGYDYVLVDCSSTLGMLTINALTAADSIIIPVQAQYLPAKGMTELVKTIMRVKRQINPELKIDGVLLTLVDARTNLAKQVERDIRRDYGSVLRVFDAKVPIAVRAAEASAYGQSIFAYDRRGKVAEAYAAFAKEVANLGERKRTPLEPALAR